MKRLVVRKWLTSPRETDANLPRITRGLHNSSPAAHVPPSFQVFTMCLGPRLSSRVSLSIVCSLSRTLTPTTCPHFYLLFPARRSARAAPPSRCFSFIFFFFFFHHPPSSSLERATGILEFPLRASDTARATRLTQENEKEREKSRSLN